MKTQNSRALKTAAADILATVHNITAADTAEKSREYLTECISAGRSNQNQYEKAVADHATHVAALEKLQGIPRERRQLAEYRRTTARKLACDAITKIGGTYFLWTSSAPLLLSTTAGSSSTATATLCRTCLPTNGKPNPNPNPTHRMKITDKKFTVAFNRFGSWAFWRDQNVPESEEDGWTVWATGLTWEEANDAVENKETKADA